MAEPSLSPIRFACQCGKKFEVGRDHIGKQTVCPECKKPMTVPAESTVAQRRKKKRPAASSPPTAGKTNAAQQNAAKPGDGKTATGKTATGKTATGKTASPASGGKRPAGNTAVPSASAASNPEPSVSEAAPRVSLASLLLLMRKPVANEKLALYAGVGGFVGGLLCGMVLMLPWAWRSTPPVAAGPEPATTSPASTPPPPAAATVREPLPVRPGTGGPTAETDTPAATAGAQLKTPWKNADCARLSFTLTPRQFEALDPGVFPERNFPLRFEANLAAKENAVRQGMPADEVAMRYTLGAWPQPDGSLEVVLFLFRDQLRTWPRDLENLTLQVWDARTLVSEETGKESQVLFDLQLFAAHGANGLMVGNTRGRLTVLGLDSLSFRGVPFTLEPFELLEPTKVKPIGTAEPDSTVNDPGPRLPPIPALPPVPENADPAFLEPARTPPAKPAAPPADAETPPAPGAAPPTGTAPDE
ncbi:hypothetical protein [Lignipirellula cremea]|uniref:Uncharacterized protein n=1 Tax=Lignipirellula cremea TaxID=2528010 RepID=A0A518DN53_9BACT|nr:hypothetical protein [Lignipirellula cremea]QDU93269.1 hypothetical protein Pla8534_10490 [Lignipirellula cremea]